MQSDAVARAGEPQVVRRVRRDEQQQRVLVPALDLAVHMRERIGVVARDMPVELVVVLFADLALRPRPQRRRLVHGRVPLGLAFLTVVRLVGLFLGLARFGRHQNRDADVV